MANRGKRSRTLGYRPDVMGLEDRWLMTTVPRGYASTVLVQGISKPTSFALAPDGRIFVAQQTGEVRVVQGGQLQAAPFVTVNTDPSIERGLLGIAVDPNFATRPWVYLYYTVPGGPGTPAHNRVSRFLASGNLAVAGSEQVLLDLPALDDQHHNAGALSFGADGTLFISVGDNDHPEYAQSLDVPFGKILRINSNGTIPSDNPFYNSAVGINKAIWAYGLRNPFTTAVQPGTGTFFINEVGENTYEEIDVGAPGANYGWPQTEGPTSVPGISGPLFAYTHGPNDRNGSAITGGAFDSSTRPLVAPGTYFFSDFTGGSIHRLNSATGVAQPFASKVPAASIGLRTDPSTGNLLVLSRGKGTDTGEITVISHAVMTHARRRR